MGESKRRGVVLTGFKESKLIQRFPQNKLNNLFTKFIASSKCVQSNVQNQEEANQILRNTHQQIERYALKENHIHFRNTVLLTDDHFSLDKKELKLPFIYDNFYENPKGRTVDVRMRFFKEKTQLILDDFFKADIKIPEHIIFVTSTGYESPNPLQELLSKKNWETTHTNCFANDCYAAFPAIEMAIGNLYNPFTNYSEIDLAHVEFNSIHVDISDDSPENLIVMSLFGDGAIQYKVTNNSNATGIRVDHILQKLIPNSSDQMNWSLGSYQFKMTLKPYVPLFIDDHIEAFVQQLFKHQSITLAEAKQKAIWAIHPGGPKIVDFIQQKLNLSDEQVIHSRKVLHNYGNMSSATLPHIWRDIIDDDSINKQTPIVSLAFGPGLTVYGLVGEKV